MSVQDFNIHIAMRSYESLHAETLDLLAESHEHAEAQLKAEEGMRVKVEHYFEKLRTANQKMEGIVTSLTGKVNAYQLKEYQTDLEQLKKKVALVQSFFLEKKVEERAEEGKSDPEEALPVSRSSAPLPDEMRLEVLQRVPLQELSEMRRVSKGWNTFYKSTIKPEFDQLAATFYPKDAVAAQAFKENLHASFAHQPSRMEGDGINKLNSTECLLLAALIASNIRGFQQGERLSSTFPLLHPSLQNALAMQASLASEGKLNTLLKKSLCLSMLVDRLLAVPAPAIPQAVAVATAIPCMTTRSKCLSTIAQKAPGCGYSLEEVVAILRLIPKEDYQIGAANQVADDLINRQKIEEAIDLMLHLPVYFRTINKTIDLLNAQNKLERAISFARDLQESTALEHISSIFMGKGSTGDAISFAKEIPNAKLKRSTLRRVVEEVAKAGRFEEALRLARENIEEPPALSNTLDALISRLLPDDRCPWDLQVLHQASDIARSMPDLDTQSKALVEIVKKYMLAEHLSEAMDLMERIQTPEEKDHALSKLISFARSKPLIDRELELTLVRKIAAPSLRSQELKNILISRLRDLDTDLEAARALVEEMPIQWIQGDALQSIVRFMLQRGDDRAHILEIAHQIRDEKARDETLKLIP